MSHIEQLIFPVRGSQFAPQRGLIKRLTPASGDNEGSIIELRREPSNKKDPNAVGVWSAILQYQDGETKQRRFRLGYVPKEYAKQINVLINKDLLLKKEIHQLLSTRYGWKVSVRLEYKATRTQQTQAVEDPKVREVMEQMAVPNEAMARSAIELAMGDGDMLQHLITSYNEECFAEPGL